MKPEAPMSRTVGRICGCVILAAVATSCSSLAYDTDHRSWPCFPDYALKGKLNPELARNLIDTNSVYVLEQGIYRLWFRFWADGHVLWRSRAIKGRPPTQEECEVFDHCCMGYYTVEEGRILVELYGRGAYLGYYDMSELKVEGEDLVQTRAWERWRPEWYGSLYYGNGRVFRRLIIAGGLKAAPDW